MKIEYKYYILLSLRAFAFSLILSIYSVFLKSKGLSLAEIGYLSAASYITVFIFEMPTGIISDVWGHKTSFILSCIVSSVGMMILYFTNNFASFLFAEILSGISLTLFTGSLVAWFINEKKKEKVKYFVPYFARASIFMKTMMMLGGLLGGYLSAENVNNPFLFSGIIMLMTAATAWYVMNNSKPTKKHKINFIKYTKIVIKDSLNTSKGNIKIKLLFLRGVLFAFAVQSINSYYQIFFKNMGLNNMILGWIYVLISLSMIIGQKITEKKVTPVNRFKFLLSFDLLTVIFILISATVIEVNISIVFFLLHEVCRGGNEPIVSDLYNAEIHDQSRATLISFRSMIGTIGATIGAFVYSFISKHLIISRMWWISGLLLFVVFLITYKLAKAYYTSLKETIEKGQNIEV